MRKSDAQEMTKVGIWQDPHPLLHAPTTPYDLPRETDIAQNHFAELREVADEVFALHQSTKGLGIAAPQIGIDQRIAILRPWQGREICLLNAQIIDRSKSTDIRYEGCLSLFDVRGRVERPLMISVRSHKFDGTVWEQTFTNGLARLICHELDHLDGVLYPKHMSENTISADEYRTLPATATDWNYDS